MEHALHEPPRWHFGQRCNGSGRGTSSSRMSKTFKLSIIPAFEAKFWDVIGVYPNPPDQALVLCWTRKASARRWNARNWGCRWRRNGRPQ